MNDPIERTKAEIEATQNFCAAAKKNMVEIPK